ncbi:MAG: hypothetical protein Q8N87_01430 [bacterium]|nr:hypothetical protein [bacterium]
MKPKKTKQQEIEALKQKARDLFSAGYTTREISKILEKKRSHAWVAIVVKEKKI